MKQLKEDKRRLEEVIEHYVNEFCKKYDVKIEDINVEWLGYYNGDSEYKALLENGNIIFKLYFDDYKDLDNIPYLLYKYLRDNDMLYDD